MATLTKQVTAAADSGYIYPSTLDTTEMWVGWDGGMLNNAFARFTNVTIPKGATITSAYFQVRATSYIGLANVQTSIYLSKEANATSPTTYTAYNAKTPTTAFTNWDAPSAWAANTWYNSPDISAAVQEVVNQGTWASGNAMLILHKNRRTSGSEADMVYVGYSQSSSYAPKLVINYNTVDNRNATLTISHSNAVTTDGVKKAVSTLPVYDTHNISIISVKNSLSTFSVTQVHDVYFVGRNRTGNLWIASTNSITMSSRKGSKQTVTLTNQSDMLSTFKKNGKGMFLTVNYNSVLMGIRETIIDAELIIYLMFDTTTEINYSYDT